MKSFILMIAIFLFSATAYGEEMVTIPRSALIQIRDYVVELQGKYEEAVKELNAMDERYMLLNAELERYKRRSSGVWLGTMIGIPFPSASAQVGYVFNNNIGVTLNGGYSTKPYVQAGVTVRVGK